MSTTRTTRSQSKKAEESELTSNTTAPPPPVAWSQPPASPSTGTVVAAGGARGAPLLHDDTRSVASTTRSTTSVARARALHAEAELEYAEEIATAERRSADEEMKRIKNLAAQRLAAKRLAIEADVLDGASDAASCTSDARPPPQPTGGSGRLSTDPAHLFVPAVPAAVQITGENWQQPANHVRPDVAPTRGFATDFRTWPGAVHHAAPPLDTSIAAPAQPSALDRLTTAFESIAAYRGRDLPTFSGDPRDWLAFRAAYLESNQIRKYSAAENVGRLRAALKGEAKGTVSALLISTMGDPSNIMKALERRYGRPEDLVTREVQLCRELPKLTGAPKNLNEFACKVQNCVATVKACGQADYLHSPELVSALLQKLTDILRSKYADYAAARSYAATGAPRLETLSEFLNAEADKAMMFVTCDMTTPGGKSANPQSTGRRAPTTPQPPRQPRPSTTCAAAAPSKSDAASAPCVVCNDSHAITQCSRFKESSTEERWDLIKKARKCFKCLKGNHSAIRYRARPCGMDGCRKPHHRLLHCNNTEEEAAPSTDAETATESCASMQGALPEDAGFLEFAPVTVRGPSGDIETFALLDSGSSITLVESKIADRLGATGPKSSLQLTTVDGPQKGAQDTRRVNLLIRGRDQEEWLNLDGARTINKIGLGSQTIGAEVLRGCAHLKDIRDALPVYNRATPTIIIGKNNWHLAVASEVRQGRMNEPMASRTPLGWVLHGLCAPHITSTAMTLQVACCQTRDYRARTEDIEKLVRDNFSLESLGVAARTPRMPEEERALDTLRRTARRVDGQFEVGLLWKNEKTILPTNQQQALTRLRGIERKLAADAELDRLYREQIDGLIDAGYAERCPPGPSGQPTWYLPHFAVRNPNKPGKARIVFDAAARTGGQCLNSKLLAGPDLLSSLLGVLMRFREGAVAVTGDIKEMFLRIKIRQEDRDAQRFLWRSDPRGPVEHYRMASMIFGAASSPCSALYVKNMNAREVTTEEDLIEVIERDHYMDDAIHSTDTEVRAATVVRDVTRIHAKGGFTMRGWASNRLAALQHVDASKGTASTVELSSKEVEKTLGLVWRPAEDMLAFNLSLHRVPVDVASGARRPTKRQALSLVMSVFDPLGLTSPVTTTAKVLLQRVWRSGIGWDDELPDDVHLDWCRWLDNLQALRLLQLPRHYGSEVGATADLHVFCDASTQAYAAAVYWRFANEDGTACVVLAASKSRVAPLRPVSVPRLELQAALLGTRLAETVKTEHRTRAATTTYWTDSRTALAWVRQDARRYKPFVAHRVAEIQEATKPHEWRWVPTKMNPADLATRSPPEGFTYAHWWFNGPQFLAAPADEWPTEDTAAPPETADTQEEIRACATQAAPHSALPELQRFSSWVRLVRTTGRVLQAIDLWRAHRSAAIQRSVSRPNTGVRAPPAGPDRFIALEQHYIERAELLWTRESQQAAFQEEIAELRAGRGVARGSRLAALAPALDADGVLRPCGRLGAAGRVDRRTREPLILDGTDAYTRLLVTHYHKRMHHGSHETVINEIRQQYWVLHLRDTVRSIAHACNWCRLPKGLPRHPPAGDLPAARLQHHNRPFKSTGVDYFGPIEVTVGRRREKRWVALFTCLTTRAIHLELAGSLSADSMLLALRRMTARRGIPSEMWSDNGSNFVRANKELAEAHAELVQLGLAAGRLGITWRFIPPGAPNMGGAWEVLVRCTKRALAATLRERAPREEVLATLLAEAEHVVNCRPLTHISADPDDEEALTPNHFLLGASSGAPLPAYTTDRDLVGRSTWRTAQRLADMYWSRWVREYLPSLLPRGKPGTSQEDASVGDIVLIVDHTLPRNTWPRGEISAVHHGPDGRVRVVKVRTTAGEILRPVRRIVTLVPRREPAQAAEGTPAPHRGEPRPDVSAPTPPVKPVRGCGRRGIKRN